MPEYRYLGRSGLKIPPLSLGTMMFGQQTDDATSQRIIHKAFDQGFNFIDTADVYNGGKSEQVVGAAVKGNRDRYTIATKFTNPVGSANGVNQSGSSRKWIFEAVDNSLRRLGTDYIDLLYIHKATFEEPLGEAVRAIADLVRAGKLRYFGVSNFRGWRIAEVARLADQLNIDRPIASQPLYNLVNRTAEVEQLPAADYFGLGVVSYSPLARGILTAKYDPDQPPAPDSRAGRNDRRIQETEWRPESLLIAQHIKRHLGARGISPVDFALGWVLNNKLVTAIIAGPRTEEQWEGYVKALDYRFSADDEALVERLVAPGHTSTPGYNDPGHPVEGRVPLVGEPPKFERGVIRTPEGLQAGAA